jgi:hypothetical protein
LKRLGGSTAPGAATDLEVARNVREIERAQTLWRELKDTGRFAAGIEREIIAPNMARINTAYIRTKSTEDRANHEQPRREVSCRT